MRTSVALLALPALAFAAEQAPLIDQLKGWFNKASDSISSALPSVSVPSKDSIPDPVASVASGLANVRVHKLRLDNWKELMKPGAATSSPGLEEWMIFVTGGNKTCYGVCEHSEKAWNESVALLSASSHAPNLGLLDCETDGVLCQAWSVSPPSVQHFLIPQPSSDQSQPATAFRTIYFNRTTVTPSELAEIHTKEKYKEVTPYEGLLHPFDGQLAKIGLLEPFGYFIWGFAKIPSWAFMIAVSFFSRNIMGRRMGPQPGGSRPAAGGPAQ